jgi:hypothetical protein
MCLQLGCGVLRGATRSADASRDFSGNPGAPQSRMRARRKGWFVGGDEQRGELRITLDQRVADVEAVAVG